MSAQSTLIYQLTMKVEGLQNTIQKEFGTEHVYHQKVCEILTQISHIMQKSDTLIIEHLFELSIIPKIMQLTHKIEQHRRLNRYHGVAQKGPQRLRIPDAEVIAPPVALHKVAQKPQFDLQQQHTITSALVDLNKLLKL
jgi:hypothetical protein